MFTALVESPMPVILIGLVLEAILGVVFFTTRRGEPLIAMAVVLLLVGVGILVERLVVTERERVEMALDEAAAAIESNDPQRVKRYISSDPEHQVLRRLDYYMAQVEFEQVRIRNLSITINRLTSPPTAEARFHGIATFDDRSGSYPYRAYSGDFRVVLVLEDGQWKVRDAEGDPQRPLSKQ